MAGPYFFVAVEGNTFTVGPPVVTKLDPALLAVDSTGDTNDASAVNRYGLVSWDGGAAYLSYTNGIALSTGLMSQSAPFNVSGNVANSNWVYTAVYNSHSNVRAYAGYSTTLDLFGGAVASVDLSPYTSEPTLESARLLYRTGTNHIFLARTQADGVVRINTLTGAVDEVLTAGPYVRAIYYSAQTDRLYVESSADSGTPGTVQAFNGETLAAGATFSGAGTADGGALGHAIHIGGEVFIASESAAAVSGRLWKVDLSSAPGVVSEFGSATTIARDPLTGYIWTPWNSGVGSATPVGGSSLTGSYVLVYDPVGETLVAAISIGATGSDVMSIIYTGAGNGDGGADGSGVNVYPSILPCPQTITTAPMPRAMLGTADRPRAARAIQIDESWTEQVTWPPFTNAEYAAFKAWWETSLVYGGRWFTASWPSPRGQIPLLRRFLSRPSWAFIGGKGGGYWQVSAMIEVRGRSRTAAGTAEDFFALREDGGFILREDGGFVERE